MRDTTIRVEVRPSNEVSMHYVCMDCVNMTNRLDELEEKFRTCAMALECAITADSVKSIEKLFSMAYSMSEIENSWQTLANKFVITVEKYSLESDLEYLYLKYKGSDLLELLPFECRIFIKDFRRSMFTEEVPAWVKGV